MVSKMQRSENTAISYVDVYNVDVTGAHWTHIGPVYMSEPSLCLLVEH